MESLRLKCESVLKKFFSLIVLMTVSLSLFGCATTEKYRKMVEVWKGQNIQSLVDTWGYPKKVITAPDGNKVYVYQHKQTSYSPGYSTSSVTDFSAQNGNLHITQIPGYSVGSQTFHYDCTTWFEVNHKHKIVHVVFRGNDCVAE